jgi:Ca2+-binding RTX toxin-like protein
MTPISSANNATALSILQRMNQSGGTGSEATGNASLSILGPLEPIGNASKQATATIVAIVNDGGTIDLSAYSGNAVVSAGNNGTIITGDGNDSISAGYNATIRSNGGNDAMSVYDNATIDSGSGDDVISTYRNATITAGAGNDRIFTYDGSAVDAGDGEDFVYVGRHATVNGGAGDDQIETYDYATIDAGDGDDVVLASGNSTITGGAGNDTLLISKWGSDGSTHDDASVDGGEGDDFIQVNSNSTVTGGTGNDTIILAGDSNTVIFNKGDGQDVIGIGATSSHESATINILGYAADDVTVTQGEAGIAITFKESDDQLSLHFADGATAKLAFEDGSTLDVVPTSARTELNEQTGAALFQKTNYSLLFGYPATYF